jgi:hypothetical protein
MNAVDLKTGEKCSESDLLANANVFVQMYLCSFSQLLFLTLALLPQTQQQLHLLFSSIYLLVNRRHWNLG